MYYLLIDIFLYYVIVIDYWGFGFFMGILSEMGFVMDVVLVIDWVMKVVKVFVSCIVLFG